jgi:hypothetical protein
MRMRVPLNKFHNLTVMSLDPLVKVNNLLSIRIKVLTSCMWPVSVLTKLLSDIFHTFKVHINLNWKRILIVVMIIKRF